MESYHQTQKHFSNTALRSVCSLQQPLVFFSVVGKAVAEKHSRETQHHSQYELTGVAESKYVGNCSCPLY